MRAERAWARGEGGHLRWLQPNRGNPVLGGAGPFPAAPAAQVFAAEGMHPGHGRWRMREVLKEGRGIFSFFRTAALKSNNSIQVEEGWQLGGEKKEKQTIKKNQ